MHEYQLLFELKPDGASGALEQAHEPIIHVVLHLAVEEAQTRLAGNEVDFHMSLRLNAHGIFYDVGGRLTFHPGELEAVAMKVERMELIAAIAKNQSVPPCRSFVCRNKTFITSKRLILRFERQKYLEKRNDTYYHSRLM